mgnify:CR=1 FL=1
MKLKITKTKNTSILYVQKAYRDKNGKSISKIHERLGTLEEVRERDVETEIPLNGPRNISPGLRHRRRRDVR